MRKERLDAGAVKTLSRGAFVLSSPRSALPSFAPALCVGARPRSLRVRPRVCRRKRSLFLTGPAECPVSGPLLFLLISVVSDGTWDCLRANPGNELPGYCLSSLTGLSGRAIVGGSVWCQLESVVQSGSSICPAPGRGLSNLCAFPSRKLVLSFRIDTESSLSDYSAYSVQIARQRQTREKDGFAETFVFANGGCQA